jgi:hypothetical protein
MDTRMKEWVDGSSLCSTPKSIIKLILPLVFLFYLPPLFLDQRERNSQLVDLL